MNAATAFDVMWAVMLAMKETSKDLSTMNNGKYSLENNSEIVGKSVVTNLLNEKLKSVSFEGLTVRCGAINS